MGYLFVSFLSYFLLILSVVTHLAGVLTPGWVLRTQGTREYEEGIFQSCAGEKCIEIPHTSNLTDSAVVVRVMLGVGVTSAGFSCLVGLAVLVALIREEAMSTKPPLLVLSLTLVSAVANAVGGAIFGTEMYDDRTDKLAYAFYMFLAGAIAVPLFGFIYFFTSTKFFRSLPPTLSGRNDHSSYNFSSQKNLVGDDGLPK